MPAADAKKIEGADEGGASWAGRNLHFGVREHAMGAIVNGMAGHGAFIPYGSTFLIFSDYMRPAIRLAALQKLHALHIFTHDSIALGEDGPTHQPIEQLREPARDPRPHRDPSGRRERDRGRLEGRDHDEGPPGAAGADAPGRADARSLQASERRTGVAKGAYVIGDTPSTTRPT